MTKKGLQLEPITSWMKVDRPVIISGPCSAETEDQMVATAKQIAATGKVHALRAGIWKPRTRPGQYEGAGEEGLKWLNARQSRNGITGNN
jgi:chorismate mutase